jgi:acetyl-CoA carboxylase biotin carboxyl carrier protein
MKRSGKNASDDEADADKAAVKASSVEAAADLVRALAEVLGDFDLTEVEVAQGDLQVRLVRQQSAVAPVAAAPPAAAPAPVASLIVSAAPPAPTPTPLPAAEHPGVVKSPMVGTVYRRANPEAKAFVEIGSMVKAGDRILLVEAMKTFNDIVAPRAGTVIEILVEDGQPVEYGEPLLVIE